MRLLVLLAVIVLLAVPAGAIDLTGTWEGNFKCDEFNGFKKKVKQENEILQITQTLTVLNILWTTASVGPSPMQGIAINDNKKMEFFGTLSLENNGGFASVRARAAKLGLAKGAVIIARGRGDGGGGGTENLDEIATEHGTSSLCCVMRAEV